MRLVVEIRALTAHVVVCLCGAALRRRKKERTRPDRRKLLEADAEEANLLGAYARVLSRMDDDDEAKLPSVHKSRTVSVSQCEASKGMGRKWQTTTTTSSRASEALSAL